MSDADFSFDAHERLALAMLAVQTGDGAAEIGAAMKKIIESAPASTDVALVLSLALAHAGDRALTGDGPAVARLQARAISASALVRIRLSSSTADEGEAGGQIMGRER